MWNDADCTWTHVTAPSFLYLVNSCLLPVCSPADLVFSAQQQLRFIRLAYWSGREFYINASGWVRSRIDLDIIAGNRLVPPHRCFVKIKM